MADNPNDYIGNEYNLYNPAILRRFGNPELVRVRVEHADEHCVQYSVVFPREFDGAFLMSDFDTIKGQTPD